MADPPPIRLHIDPPMDQWRVTPRNGRTTPVIATGHQPYLWHPGILAKDLAADAFAKHIAGTALHVVVEHNTIDTRSFEVPQQIGGNLAIHHCQLSQTLSDENLPPNVAKPIDTRFAVERLDDEASVAATTSARCIHAGLKDLADGFDTVGENYPDHAQQMTLLLHHLMRPHLHRPMQTLLTRHVVTPVFVDRLLSDPAGCVRAYNRAARAYPEAGIRPLYLGRDVVEAPLWAQDATTCTPVYIDLGDSKRPYLFTTQHNQQLDLAAPNAIDYLRPRAITLSAIMRSEHCDLFIHGSGGGVYDQVTERWWHDWVGEELAPMAVVSADMFLPFDAPTATRDERIQAQWFAHHLPHNVDLYTEAVDTQEASLRREKQDLLDHMNDDRDKRRRASAFKRIHAINSELQSRHAESLHHAQQRSKAMRIGVANARIARRRDWCFALYPDASLKELADQIRSRLTASPQ